MVELQAQMLGDDEIVALLKKLESPDSMKPAFHRIGVSGKSFLKRYPPQPPNSRYRRTGTLGRKWTFAVRRKLFGIETLFGNNTLYAPDVQGQGTQAEIHAGRWQTDQDMLDQKGDEFVQEVNEEIDDLLRS